MECVAMWPIWAGQHIFVTPCFSHGITSPGQLIPVLSLDSTATFELQLTGT